MNLIELLGLLIGLELLELYRLIYVRLSTGSEILVFFTKLKLMRFQVRYLDLFRIFSVKDGFEWLWMGSVRKNVQLMLMFLKAPFLVPHFSYSTSMTLLILSSVILLSMLMIQLSVLSVNRCLICSSNQSWLLNLNLTYETL